MKYIHYPRHLFQAFIQMMRPRSRGSDKQRQKLILEVFFIGFVSAAIIASINCAINFIVEPSPYYRNKLLITLLASAFLIGLAYAFRKGYQRVSGRIFVVLLAFIAVLLTVQLGFDVPQVQLFYALILIFVGVLINARVGLTIIGIIMTLGLVVANLQIYNKLNPGSQWLTNTFIYGRPAGYAIIMSTVGLVSLLTGSVINRSWRRARSKERAVLSDRVDLEDKISERTRQLKEAQLMRSMELQRFAEFGRLNANLIHDLTNPLTAATINLDMLDHTQDAALLLRVRQNLKHVERYVEAARQQVKGQSTISSFSVRAELTQLLESLRPRADQANVIVKLQPGGNFKLTGDAVKFNKLMSNLIANAIDAYVGIETDADKLVEVAVSQTDAGMQCSVIDRGVGIPPDAIKKIYEPFYSTKSDSPTSMGIGLAMVKQFVEHDFNGKITVKSSPATGTYFLVKLSRQPLKAATPRPVKRLSAGSLASPISAESA
ncbi:MAG: HAMP domain-containing sensor histidine kinase [Candidatus Saccharibacteria bacterium]